MKTNGLQRSSRNVRFRGVMDITSASQAKSYEFVPHMSLSILSKNLSLGLYFDIQNGCWPVIGSTRHKFNQL